MKKTVVIRVFSAMAMMPALSIAAEPASEHPTYAKEVSRIIQDNCQICHQPGQIGPMSFTSYEEILPWAPLGSSDSIEGNGTRDASLSIRS
jgi:mono/diheme cytochrome c family protein